MFGKKKREMVESSVANASIGSSDMLEPGKIPMQPDQPVQPMIKMSKREQDILELIEEINQEYGMLSASDVANMSQTVRDAYLLNLVLALAVELRQLRVFIEKMERDSI